MERERGAERECERERETHGYDLNGDFYNKDYQKRHFQPTRAEHKTGGVEHIKASVL